MSKSALRTRITPSVPFILKVEDAEGTFSLSFRLSYDFNSLTAVEDLLGKSMMTDIGEILDNPSAKNTSILLWGALQVNHPEYEGIEGLKVVRNLLTIGQAALVGEACSEAYLLQLPAEQVKALKEIQAARKAGVEVPLVKSPVVL